MKILFITRLYWPHIGGVERHIAGLIKHAPKDVVITVLTEGYEEEVAKLDSPGVVRIPTYKSTERQKKFIIWQWMINNWKYINSFDIVHIHDTVFWIYPIWPIIKPKLYCTFHGWEGTYPLPKKNILQKKIDAKLVKKSIAVGEFIAKWYGIKVSAVTYGAVDSNFIKTTSKKNNHLLFLGRVDKDTGFEDCLLFLRQYPELNLTVAGSGTLPIPKSPRITYLGAVIDPAAHIHSAKWVFTTGYMGILESFIAKKQVYVSAGNPLKNDYLRLHPMVNYLHFDRDLNNAFDTEIPYKWAVSQNYKNLWNTYLNLWHSKN